MTKTCNKWGFVCNSVQTDSIVAELLIDESLIATPFNDSTCSLASFTRRIGPLFLEPKETNDRLEH